jgi:hypothetical protein
MPLGDPILLNNKDFASGMHFLFLLENVSQNFITSVSILSLIFVPPKLKRDFYTISPI